MTSLSTLPIQEGEFDADLDALLNIVDDETEREIENYDNRHRRYDLTTHALIPRERPDDALFDRNLLLAPPHSINAEPPTFNGKPSSSARGLKGPISADLEDVVLGRTKGNSAPNVPQKRCMSSIAQNIEDGLQDFDFNEAFGQPINHRPPSCRDSDTERVFPRQASYRPELDFITLTDNDNEILPARQPRQTTSRPVAADVILLPPRKMAKLLPTSARHLQHIDRAQVLTLVEQVKQTVVQRVSTNSSGGMIDTNLLQSQLLRSVNNKLALQIWLTEPLDFDTVAISGVAEMRRVYARHRRAEHQSYMEKLADESVFEHRAFDRMREMVDRARAATVERRSSAPTTLHITDAGSDNSSSTSLKRLWVDRFRPLAYIELLSEEQVNLTLLTWFKSWDVVVFNKEKSAGDIRKMTASLKRHKAEIQQKKNQFSKQSGKWRKVIDVKVNDPRNGPDQKLVLLAGPPGLGKTTMAHVIARQAGFDVLEVNASDERGLDLIRTRVDDTLNNTSIRTSKPKCLIMDEIDGLPANTANYLVTLLKNSAKSSNSTATKAKPNDADDDADNADEVDGQPNSLPAKKRQRRKKVQKLVRPIIAICNDLYTPSLRELRRHALVIHCPSISRQKLIHRLNYICHTTRTQADMTTLNLLCEKAADDIRTCINTLQFLSDRSPNICTADIVGMQFQNANKKNIFQLLGSIFKLPAVAETRAKFQPSRKTSTAGGATESSGGGNDADERAELILHHSHAMRVHQLVQQNGEDERLMHAVHENYLQIRSADTRIDAVQQVSDWFCYADMFDRAGGVDDQRWALKGYAKFLAPATYLHTASARRTPEFTYPMMAFNLQRERQEHCAAVQALMQTAPADVYAYCNDVATFSADIAPHLANFMLPSLSNNTATSSRLNPSDAIRVSRAVDLMLSYGLSFREEHQHTSPAGEGSGAIKTLFVPEPNLEKMAKLNAPVIGFNGFNVQGNATKSVDAVQQSSRVALAAELDRRRAMHLRAFDYDSTARPQQMNVQSMFAKAEQTELLEREMCVRDAEQPWRSSVSFDQNNLADLQVAADHKSLLRRLNSVNINIHGSSGGDAVGSNARAISKREASVANIKSSSKQFGYYRYCEGNIQPAIRCAFIEDITN